MKLVALAGYQGSGKTTAAKYLEQLNKNIHLAKFAGSVKYIASTIYNTSILYWETDKNIKQELLQNKTKREVLQVIGTALRANLDENIWIYSLDLYLKELPKYTDVEVVVIDDLRFPNELDFIKSKNGLVVYIDRELDITDKHESESHYELIKSNADIVIYNTTDLNNLHKQLNLLVDVIHS